MEESENKRQRKPKFVSKVSLTKASDVKPEDKKDLKGYLDNKQRSKFEHGMKNITQKKHQKPKFVNRLGFAKMTEMLHEYISAHKFKSASETKHAGGNSGAFSLVSGQTEAMKTEFSAVTMHPKEKVN